VLERQKNWRWIPAGATKISLFKFFRLLLRPTHLAIAWVPVVISPGLNQLGGEAGH